MKVWKKLSLVLCLSFAFSGFATACRGNDDGNSSSSSSNNSSSSSSSSESSIPDDNEEEVEEESEEEKIKNMALSMFSTMISQVRSAKLDVNLMARMETKITQGAYTTGTWTEYSLTGDAYVTLTDTGVDGVFNLQLPLTDSIGEVDERQFYLLDGYVYEYHQEENVYERYQDTLYEIVDEWVQTNTNGEISLTTLLGVLIGDTSNGIPSLDFDLSSESVQGVLEKGAEVDATMSNGAVKVSIDTSEAVGEIFDFIKSIDEKTTVGDVVDYPLSVLFPDAGLTSEGIVKELYMHDDDTVSEFVAWLNEQSLQYTGMSLQTSYDLLFKNEFVHNLLAQVLDEETANALQEFDLESFAQSYGDSTMDDLVSSSTMEILSFLDNFGINSEDFAELSGVLDWSTLMYVAGEILEFPFMSLLPEGSIWAQGFAYAQNMDVTASDLDVTIQFNDNLVLESITLDGTLGVGYVQESIAYTLEGNATVIATELRSIQQTISLPEGAVVVIKCDSCLEKKVDTTTYEGVEGFYCPDCYALLLPQGPNDSIV